MRTTFKHANRRPTNSLFTKANQICDGPFSATEDHQSDSAAYRIFPAVRTNHGIDHHFESNTQIVISKRKREIRFHCVVVHLFRISRIGKSRFPSDAVHYHTHRRRRTRSPVRRIVSAVRPLADDLCGNPSARTSRNSRTRARKTLSHHMADQFA